MLFVYTINILYIFGYFSVSIWFWFDLVILYIEITRVFEGFGPVPDLDILVRFWFGSSVPVFWPSSFDDHVGYKLL